MSLSLTTLALAFAVLASLAAEPTTAGVPGGYSPASMTADLGELLMNALKTEKLYRPSVSRRICVNDVVSVKQQVVAGMNYAFTVTGCDVAETLKLQLQVATKADIAAQLGACKPEMKANCVPIRSIVTVFEQSWTNRIEVSSIIVQK